MSKSQLEQAKEEVTQEETSDFSKLDTDQQLGVICASLEAVCNSLEQRGVDPEMLNAVLLETFAARMADINDREGYEAMLEEAIDTEWNDVTVH